MSTSFGEGRAEFEAEVELGVESEARESESGFVVVGDDAVVEGAVEEGREVNEAGEMGEGSRI